LPSAPEDVGIENPVEDEEDGKEENELEARRFQLPGVWMEMLYWLFSRGRFVQFRHFSIDS